MQGTFKPAPMHIGGVQRLRRFLAARVGFSRGAVNRNRRGSLDSASFVPPTLPVVDSGDSQRLPTVIIPAIATPAATPDRRNPSTGFIRSLASQLRPRVLGDIDPHSDEDRDSASRVRRSEHPAYARDLNAPAVAPPKPASPLAAGQGPRGLPHVQGPLQSPESQLDLARRIEREAPPRPVPAAARQFLADRLGLWLPSVFVHTGPAADRLARMHRADAVTFSDRIAFRHGQYDPATDAGRALLGHEFTHIDHARRRGRPGASQPSGPYEERIALANERRLLSVTGSPDPGAEAFRPTPREGGESRIMHPHVQAARVDRSVDFPAPPSPALSPQEMARITDEVYRDLRDRLRSEFERGS